MDDSPEVWQAASEAINKKGCPTKAKNGKRSDGDHGMMNRRRFLSAGMIGAGLASTSSLAAASAVRHAEPIATMNIFDKKWAQADLEHLGIPKSWWHVHQGLFPLWPTASLL